MSDLTAWASMKLPVPPPLRLCNYHEVSVAARPS